MCNVVISAALAAAILAVSSVAAISAPMNSLLVCKAAASLNQDRLRALHLFAARFSRPLLHVELPLIAPSKQHQQE